MLQRRLMCEICADMRFKSWRCGRQCLQERLHMLLPFLCPGAQSCRSHGVHMTACCCKWPPFPSLLPPLTLAPTPCSPLPTCDKRLPASYFCRSIEPVLIQTCVCRPNASPGVWRIPSARFSTSRCSPMASSSTLSMPFWQQPSATLGLMCLLRLML